MHCNLGMLVILQKIPALVADGAIAQRCAYVGNADDADVFGERGHEVLFRLDDEGLYQLRIPRFARNDKGSCGG